MNIRATAILGGIEEVQPWDSIFPFEISNLHTLVAVEHRVPEPSGSGTRGGKKRDKLKLKQQRKSRRRNR